MAEINKESKTWQTFLAYHSLISQEGKEVGLDVYGTDMSTEIAAKLTIAHMIDENSNMVKQGNKIAFRKS